MNKIDPLHQFEIFKIIPINIFGVDLSFTNSSLFMVGATLLIMAFQYYGARKKAMIPSRFQSMVEVSYEFIADMVKDNTGNAGMVYFPFIFSIFMFVLMGNLLGMVPYFFTFTSHIVVTFALAFTIFIMVTVIGFAKHGWKFLRMFCPEGVPLAVTPILVPVEIIAYLMRPITLSVRLFANMLTGHILLKLFGAFTIAWGVVGILPFGINVMFTGFEFFVAFIQAYIFTILTCIYLNDALHLH